MFEIRPAIEIDTSGILLLRHSFFENQIAAGLLDIPENMDEMLKKTTPHLVGRPRSICLVAVQDNTMVGYIYTVTKIVPGARKSVVGSVEEVFVQSSARGSGIAEKLFRAATTLMQDHGASRIQLRVLAGNPKGRIFWNRMGFSENVAILEYTNKDHSQNGA